MAGEGALCPQPQPERRGSEVSDALPVHVRGIGPAGGDAGGFCTALCRRTCLYDARRVLSSLGADDARKRHVVLERGGNGEFAAAPCADICAPSSRSLVAVGLLPRHDVRQLEAGAVVGAFYRQRHIRRVRRLDSSAREKRDGLSTDPLYVPRRTDGAGCRWIDAEAALARRERWGRCRRAGVPELINAGPRRLLQLVARQRGLRPQAERGRDRSEQRRGEKNRREHHFGANSGGVEDARVLLSSRALAAIIQRKLIEQTGAGHLVVRPCGNRTKSPSRTIVAILGVVSLPSRRAAGELGAACDVEVTASPHGGSARAAATTLPVPATLKVDAGHDLRPASTFFPMRMFTSRWFVSLPALKPTRRGLHVGKADQLNRVTFWPRPARRIPPERSPRDPPSLDRSVPHVSES